MAGPTAWSSEGRPVPGGLTPEERIGRSPRWTRARSTPPRWCFPSPTTRASTGWALVEFVGSDCPADGQLFPGDRIVRIEDQRVDSQDEASRLLDGVPTDEPIDFRIDTDGQMHDVRLTRGRCPGSEQPVVGIVLIDAFPFPIAIERRRRRAVGGADVGGRALTCSPRGTSRRGGRSPAPGRSTSKEHQPDRRDRDKVIATPARRTPTCCSCRGPTWESSGASTWGSPLIPVGSFDERPRAGPIGNGDPELGCPSMATTTVGIPVPRRRWPVM